MFKRIKGHLVAIAPASAGLAMVAGNAAATPTGPDFSSILSGVDNQCSANSYEGWGAGIVGCTDGGSNFGD